MEGELSINFILEFLRRLIIDRYRAAGKNQTFMFFVAVIHSEQHTIYVVTDKKVQLVSPFFRTYRNNLIENLEGYRGIEECLGCSAC